MSVDIATRRRMNDHRRRIFKDAQGEIAFLCECGDDTCTRAVLLTAARFDGLRKQKEPPLYEGHLEKPR